MLRSLFLAVLAALLAVPASAQLSGTYTVGGASPDYAGIPAAVTDLMAQGVSGDVIFQIRPGTYTPGAGIDIGPITGSSPTARVRFEAEDPGDRPLLRRAGATSGSNFVVRLSGAEWVIFKDLDFEAAAPSPVGRLLVLAGNASNVTIRNCSFTGHVAPGSDEGSLIWSDGAQTHNNLTIDQSTFDSGWKGIEMDAPSLSNPTGIMVTANTFTNQQEEGIRVSGGGRVEGNMMTDGPSSNPGPPPGSYRAIVTSGGTSATMEVVGNTIDIATGRSGIDGNGGTTLIANNRVSIRRYGSEGHGIYSTGGLVAHNTVRVLDLNDALRLPQGLGVDIEIRNNILLVHGPGVAINDQNVNSIVASDDNILYTTSGALVEWEGTTYTALADWQAASGFDGGSLSQTTDFVFVTGTPGPGPWDLHLAGASLTDVSLIAPPLAGLTTDGDGDARDPYNPKRGADEGTPLPPLDNADAGGFYAVAGSSPAFADPAEAFAALVARGMKGAVTFRIRAGTFTVRESFPNAIRVGPAAADPASAPLAIRAANPGSRPTLVSGATTSFNWLLRFRGLDHVELTNLDFDASAAGDAGRVVVLSAGADGGGVDDLTINGCTFTGAASGVTSDERALLWSDADGHDDLTVSGSTFTDGAYAAWFPLPIGNDSPGAVFADNVFDGQSKEVLVGAFGGVTVTGNTFSSSVAGVKAVHLAYTDGYTITGNQMALTAPTGIGLLFVGTDATPSAPGLIANNFIRADEPVHFSNGVGAARLVHNTLYASGSNGVPLTVVANASDVAVAELVNNILYSATSDPAMSLDDAATLAVSNSNVFWSVAGSVLVEVGGTTYAALADWQAASGLDARSRSFNPSFQNAGTGDLHLAGASDGDPRFAGLPGTGILADFDGISPLRSLYNPYIGADEATELLPLSGDLYVGVTPPGFPASTYDSLAEAAEAVHYLGVTDLTTFLLYDDVGAFPVTLRAFDGASETDRLRLIPVNAGLSYSYAAADAASNGMLRLDGADHVSIIAMGFDVSGGTAPYGRALAFEGDVDDLQIVLSSFSGLTGESSGEAALLWSDGATVSNLTVDNSQFNEGSYGVLLQTGATLAPGTEILDSRFFGQRSGGVFLDGHASPVLTDVTVESAEASVRGVVLQNGTGGTVERALVTLTSTSGLVNYALVLDDQDAAPGAFAAGNVLVTNSFLSAGTQSVVMTDADGARFVHNTLRAARPTIGAVVRSVSGSDQSFVNNLILHADGGRVLAVDDPAAITEIAPNNFYTSGATLADWGGTDYADLAAFQAGTGLAASAVSLPVAFVDAAAGDLHLAGASVGDDDLGAPPLADVPDDIDGDTRSTTWAYLGADEGDVELTPPFVPAYAVTGPAPLGAFAHGDAVNAAWTTLDPTLEAGPVRVSVLCPGEAPYVRYASTDNDGMAGFVVPVSLGVHGSATDQASGCTVEVANVADPSRAAVSAPFVVYPAADKIAAVSTRAVDRLTSINPARYGRGDIVSWFWDETSVASTVDLSVVCDGRAEYVRYTATANDGVATAQLPLVFGAFETCRVEVTSSADPAVFGRSGPFEVLDTRLPALDLVAPVGDEAIAMGQTYTIEWTSESVLPETTVRLVLRDLTGGSPNRFVGTTTAGAGTFAWDVPSDLSVTDEYRLAISARLEDETVVSSSVNGLTFTAGSLIASASASAEAMPTELAVGAARPNPTRGPAMVRLGVPEAGPVEVAVYDAVGRRVAVLASGEQAAGWHALAVEADRLAPGVYVVRAVAGGTVATRTLTVVR